MQTLQRLAAITLLATACTRAAPLTDQVGQDVELTGLLGGPGKDGLYLIAFGEEVYLPDYTGLIRIGTHVVVRGKLQWAKDENPCPSAKDCPYTGVIAHYFIEGANVQASP